LFLYNIIKTLSVVKIMKLLVIFLKN